MPINQDYANAFRYGLMFGKDVKPGTTHISMSVVDKDDILLAVKKAYIDMSPRTFKSNGNNDDKDSISSGDKNKLLGGLTEKIQAYMESGLSNQSFDDWHKELCEWFLKGETNEETNEETKGLEGLLSDAGKISDQATFGKAQKIVNMTFKYMYCFDDAESHADKFEPCHMPLDSYILDWFFVCYKKDWENQNSGKKLTKSGTYHLPVWSDLKYQQGEDDIPQYKEIQAWIKNFLDKQSISRLEAEFLIWWEVRNKKEYTYKKD